MYWKHLNDANIKNGNWNKSTREKDGMLWLADCEIIKTNSKLLLFSDNRINKYLPSICRRRSKDNQKNMYHGMWNYKGEAPITDNSKQQKIALLITRSYLKKVKHSI